MEAQPSPIVESSTPLAQAAPPTDLTQPAGVPDGTILDVRNSDGKFTKEVVVHDLDDSGNIIAFHKEVSNG